MGLQLWPHGAVPFPRARFQIESSHQRCGDTRELADVGARCQHPVRLYREATHPSPLLGHTHDITLAMVSWEHLPAGTNTHTCPNTQCEQQRIHPLSPTGPDTRTQTLVHTHTRLRTCRSLWLCTRRLSSTHRAWGHLDSVQLFTPPLCPLLGLPQGTQYPWTPLHPPPQQEKGLREPLLLTSTCSISSLVPAGPGDSARLEMSPSPQGSGHRGQGQAADPSFSLLANCPREGQ